MNCIAFECMHPLVQECWINFHKDTWGDLYTSSGAVLIAECWRQALESLPQECYRFHRAAANGSLHDVAGRIPEWVVPSHSVKRGTWEQNGVCSPTQFMWGNNHAQHSPHASWEVCKFEAGLAMSENVPIEGSHKSEEMERREQLGGKNKPCICVNNAVIWRAWL